MSVYGYVSNGFIRMMQHCVFAYSECLTLKSAHTQKECCNACSIETKWKYSIHTTNRTEWKEDCRLGMGSDWFILASFSTLPWWWPQNVWFSWVERKSLIFSNYPKTRNGWAKRDAAETSTWKNSMHNWWMIRNCESKSVWARCVVKMWKMRRSTKVQAHTHTTHTYIHSQHL